MAVTFTKSYDPLTSHDKRHKTAAQRAFEDASDDWPYCDVCAEPFNPRRAALGFTTCLEHGDPKKTFTVVPVPKSNYVIATSVAQLASPYSHKGNR